MRENDGEANLAVLCRRMKVPPSHLLTHTNKHVIRREKKRFIVISSYMFMDVNNRCARTRASVVLQAASALVPLCPNSIL
jgi:hypothetical protein